MAPGRRIPALGAPQDRSWVDAAGFATSPEVLLGILRASLRRRAPGDRGCPRIEARGLPPPLDVETAEVLLRQGRPADVTGASTAGLERLAATAGAGIDGAIRAELVRAEIAQLLEAAPGIEGDGHDGLPARVRALRFAWHGTRSAASDTSTRWRRSSRCAPAAIRWPRHGAGTSRGAPGIRSWSW